MMSKRLIGFVSILIFLAACSGSPEQKAKKSGHEIYFEEVVYDYGEIIQSSSGSHGFVFKNLSPEPILINRVRSTCGCTVPSWPREPVEPGKEGEIVVRYNTELKGSFQKSIYVYSTASNSPVKLQIKGKVIQENNKPDA
jgi:hypothetical protein